MVFGRGAPWPQLLDISTHLVVCDVLDLAGEGDVAADPHRVVGQGLEEGRAVSRGGRVAEGGVGGAAWIRYVKLYHDCIYLVYLIFVFRTYSWFGQTPDSFPRTIRMLGGGSGAACPGLVNTS